ncbi:ADP-ribose pyrophosphatase YjhB, NUDIX family [Pseudobutyrivibrio sp. YE44]|uniref:NUDIX hydrolase n=1 Tax=Pseudobutyrivibrio sp. YE44 TaxID=1520802 RepID=UPI00088857FD|nr:NUDIX domain-containing protein [Pseudobutyrivibrio sp. YE44]SDB33296.1 ADP-ribose pyrophosphatase YjhB, NUDIX family [Pseudobutyrivibrio sp. YE44]
MKKIQLLNDDYLGHADIIRHACRGIVIKDGKILLSYEEKNGKYMIPGGGVEGDESLEECCARELLEETGIIVKPKDYYLEIEELFDVWQHFNHYYICDFVEDTGKLNLTEAEKLADYKPVWLPIDEAKQIFGDYEKYHQNKIEDYGLYRREYAAITEMPFNI